MRTDVKRVPTAANDVKTEAPCEPSCSLTARLAARQPQSALAAMHRSGLDHGRHDFVESLSPAAGAFLEKLPAPVSGGPTTPVPRVPPRLAEEIFAFADYALLDELRAPAIDGIMETVTIARALQLVDACHKAAPSRGQAYRTLKMRCQQFLAHNFAAVVCDPAYRALSPRRQSAVDAQVLRHVDQTLLFGARRDLPPLQDAIAHYIGQGRFAASLFDKKHVFAWLCTDASADVWQALYMQGHDMAQFILRQRGGAFRHAAQAGRRDLVAMMWDRVPEHQRDTLWTAYDHGALRYGIARSDPDMVLTILCRLSPVERAEVAANGAVWQTAAENWPMFHLLRQWFPDAVEGEQFTAHRQAARHFARSNLHTALRELLWSHPAKDLLLISDGCDLLRIACRRKDLATISVLLEAAADDPGTLDAMLAPGLSELISGSIGPGAMQQGIALFDRAARRHGRDPFAQVHLDALASACQAGHVEVAQRGIEACGPGDRRAVLPLLLEAACATAQQAVIEKVLGYATSDAEKVHWILGEESNAMLAATGSGDASLVGKFIAFVAEKAPRAWADWQTTSRTDRALRRAMVSNAPRMLELWMRIVTPPMRETAMLNGNLLATGLTEGTEATLTELFRIAGAYPGLPETLVQQALVPNAMHEEIATPLTIALRDECTAAADAVLDAIASPHQRRAALIGSFEGLCRSGLEYFRGQWQTLLPHQRTDLLTPAWLGHLPFHADADIAAWLMREHTETFMAALRPLPFERLTWMDGEVAVAIIEAAPSHLRRRILDVWAPELLHAALVDGQAAMWRYLRQAMPRDALMPLLAADGGRFFVDAHSAMKTELNTYILLDGAWLVHGSPYVALGRLALKAMLEDDDVTLLRELMARQPLARREVGLHILMQPGFRAAEHPRITAYWDARYARGLAVAPMQSM